MPRLLVLTLVLGLVGCSRQEPPAPARPVSPSEAPRPTAPPRPEPPALPASIDASFRTSDGVTLRGTLYPGPERTSPAIVLLHQLGSDRSEWAPLVAALREEPALTVLTFDMRGHGQSTTGPDGELSYGGFDTAAWTAVEEDVRAAVAYLRGEESTLLPSRIAVVGSSIGATAVIRAAARDPELDVLAVLSPGRAYHGVDAILAAVNMGPRAFLALASREELDCVETSEALARITGGRAELYDGQAHGVAMLADHDDRITTLATFLRESLARPRPAAEPPPADEDEDPTAEAPAQEAPR